MNKPYIVFDGKKYKLTCESSSAVDRVYNCHNALANDNVYWSDGDSLHKRANEMLKKYQPILDEYLIK